MPREQQVCSQPLGQRLKELGVKQESFLSWHYLSVDDRWDLNITGVAPKVVSAFTVAELGLLLPVGSYSLYSRNKQCFVALPPFEFRDRIEEQEAHTEADARAKLLIAVRSLAPL